MIKISTDLGIFPLTKKSIDNQAANFVGTNCRCLRGILSVFNPLSYLAGIPVVKSIIVVNHQHSLHVRSLQLKILKYYN